MQAREAGSPAGRRGRVRRVRPVLLVVIALAVSGSVMAGLTASAVIARRSCSGGTTRVSVAASAEIAGAAQSVAQVFNARNVVADGRCVRVLVIPAAPAAVADQVDGHGGTARTPRVDAWIPDSLLWVYLARSRYVTGAEVVQRTGITVARSPIVIATSQAVAKQTAIFSAPATWRLLLPPAYGGPPASLGLSVDLPDPADSAVGLSALIEVSRQLGRGRAGRAAFTKFVLWTTHTEQFNSAATLASFVATTAVKKALTVTSEQAAVAYDRAHPAQPLAVRYPTAHTAALGAPELDYPYVLTSPSPRLARAALAFGRFLAGSYAQSVIRKDGFRSGNGVPDTLPAGSGLSSQQLQLATPATASETATSLATWQQLGIASRVLVIIDDSAVMAVPSGLPGLSLEQVLTSTASQGLALFPDNTQMGLWEAPNSKNAKLDYRSLVSVGALPAGWGLISRREQIQQIDLSLRPSRNPLRLFDAILAAYKQLTASYSPDYSSAVVVLTAGVDSSGDMKLSALLSQLRTLYNPGKKVGIILIQFGQAGSFTAMQQIAAATGGGAYQITKPGEVARVFIEAFSQRLCGQGCA